MAQPRILVRGNQRRQVVGPRQPQEPHLPASTPPEQPDGLQAPMASRSPGRLTPSATTASWGFRGLGPLSRHDEGDQVRAFRGHRSSIALVEVLMAYLNPVDDVSLLCAALAEPQPGKSDPLSARPLNATFDANQLSSDSAPERRSGSRRGRCRRADARR
jgi:hypothetical protein